MHNYVGQSVEHAKLGAVPVAEECTIALYNVRVPTHHDICTIITVVRFFCELMNLHYVVLGRRRTLLAAGSTTWDQMER